MNHLNSVLIEGTVMRGASVLSDGSLRVSGRLENTTDGHVFINAEGVELKVRL